MGGKTLQDNLRIIVSRAVEEAARNAGTARKSGQAQAKNNSDGPLSGGRGVLVGAGAAALAPLAVKGVGKLAKGVVMNGLGNIASKPAKAVGDIAGKPAKAVGDIASKPVKAVEKLGSGVGGAIGDKVSEKVEEAGGAAGMVKDAAKSALPFGGGDSDDKSKEGIAGVGKGRRMPIQQSVEIGVPIESVYNQWTQFEKWPEFMHRVTRVTQEDDCTVSFATKIWGKTKEFTAKIESQRPDERVKWRVSQGMTHTGVVTFHELSPRLTKVQLSFDVDPGGLLEKLARGARHIKRAARGDLHRFKAYLEMHELETGAWRGVIEEGKVTKKHDSSYDKKREYFEESGGKRRKTTRKRSSSKTAAQRSSGSSRSSSRSGRSSSASGRSSSASSRSGSSRSQGSSGRARQSSRSSGRNGSSGSSGSGGSRSSSARSGSNSSSGRSRSSSARSGSNSSSGRSGSGSGSGRSGSGSGSGRSGSGSSRSSGGSSSGSSRSGSSTRSRAHASRSNGSG